MNRVRLPLLVVAAFLAGCTTVPTGPSNLALPGSARTFDEFRSDDGTCRQYALDSVGGQTTTRVQEDSAARSVLAGAVLGALAGAAINGGHGAAVGAGVGAAGGGIAGVGASEVSASEAQRRYDHAYIQCMYGKGHRVAVSGFAPEASRPYSYRDYRAPRYSYGPPPPPPPGVSVPPPPPPGSAPPPPPPAPRQ